MPNMSYCRFENTYKDLKDCAEAMGDGVGKLSPSEEKYYERLIKLCSDIAADYGEREEEDDE